MKDDNTIFQSPRRLPYKEREIVDEQNESWLNEGIIEPCESEYASPFVVTYKKCGTPRTCINYRKINNVMKDRYPLPLIEDQLDKLQNASIYSTIDLKNRFFHVIVKENNRKYIAFVTNNGHY